MNYPKWLEHGEKHNFFSDGWLGDEHDKLIEMAKDAWKMAYYRGTEEGALGIEEFLKKYGDADEGAGI